MALGRRQEVPVTAIVNSTRSSESRRALRRHARPPEQLERSGAPAVESLQNCLIEQDLWLRVHAAQALPRSGQPPSGSAEAVWLCWPKRTGSTIPAACNSVILPSPYSMAMECSAALSKALTAKRYTKRFRAGLKNQDGRARGSLSSVYRNLSAQEIKPLLPAIYQAITEPAPEW